MPAGERAAQHFQLELIKVPYRGTAPQLTELVAGHVQIGGADYGTALPHFHAGKLRPLLVIGRLRKTELPDVPTTAELGLTEPDFTIWNGMLAPAAIPASILARLRAALASAVETEAVRAVLDGNGNRAILQTGEEASRRLAHDLASRRAYAQGFPSSGS